jgi:hypothetical protein
MKTWSLAAGWLAGRSPLPPSPLSPPQEAERYREEDEQQRQRVEAKNALENYAYRWVGCTQCASCDRGSQHGAGWGGRCLAGGASSSLIIIRLPLYGCRHWRAHAPASSLLLTTHGPTEF